MGRKAYLIISGSIFGLISIMHMVRLINRWTFQLGDWTFPVWISWFGLFISGTLCLWAYRLARE